MHDDQPENHRVTLVGGPLDGWPIEIRGRLPDQLRLPYSRAMLELAGRPPQRGEWKAMHFPSEAEADGVAVYRRDYEDEQTGNVARYRFTGDEESFQPE